MEDVSERVRVHLKIQGRVQGVYFRASAVTQAQNLRVTGWVTNARDGSVEALAEGSRTTVEEFIAWCRRGPSGARVTDVQIEWQEPQENFSGFSIRR